MSLVTPTTAEIKENIIAAINAALSQTVQLLPKAFIDVLAKALAAVFVLVYKYAGFIFLQQYVQTATIEDVEILGVIISPLKFWGRLIGVGDPVPATQAEMDIDIIVENQTGTLPAGTQLVNTSNGVVYVLTVAVTLSAPVVSGSIIAVGDQGGGSGAGTIGNLAVGDIVSFVNPLPNVAQDTAVTVITVTAADAEDTEVYRQRILDRFSKRLQGGALVDYEAWGEEVAGIVNVYPYTGDRPGEVDVFSEASVASSPPDGIPTNPQLQAVLDSITFDDAGLASRRPANAFVNSFPITRTGFDVEVSGLAVDNPTQVQLDIDAAVVTFFLGREPFVSGVTLPPRTDLISQADLISLVNDIVSAVNGTFTAVSFSETAVGIPLPFYNLGRGEKSKLSTSVAFV